jgi:hypothetical protein
MVDGEELRNDDNHNPAPTFDFPEEVADLEKVPEKLRRFYFEREGKYIMRDPDSLERAQRNAKASEQAAKKELSSLRDRLEKYGDLGESDIEEYRKMKAEQAEREEREAAKKGEWDKLRSQMKAEHTTELEAQKAEVERLRGELRSEKIDSKLQEALASNEATAVGLKLLPYDLKKSIDFVEEDGKFYVRILGDDGKTARVNADGDYLQISDLVKEAREAYPDLFKGSVASGGGAPNQSASNGVTSQGKVKPAKEMSDADKAAFIAEHGIEAWKKHLGL